MENNTENDSTEAGCGVVPEAVKEEAFSASNNTVVTAASENMIAAVDVYMSDAEGK